MIVFLHSYNLPENFKKNYIFYIENFVTNGITRSAVPFFFILSGFLFFHNFRFSFDNYLIKLKKRIKSILIPFLLWSLFYLILALLLNQINIKIVNYSIISICDFIYYLILKPIPFQLWFLRDLFIIVVVSPLIYLLLKKSGVVLLLILFVIWFNNYQIFIVIDNESAMFFTFGAYVSLYDSKNMIQKKTKNKYLLMCLILWISTNILKLDADLIIRNLYIHRVSQISGLFFLWYFYDFIYDKYGKEVNYENVLWIRDYGFFIFLLHEPLLSLIKKSTLRFFNYEFLYLLSYFMYPILIIFFCVVIGMFLKKNFKYYKILTGGR